MLSQLFYLLMKTKMIELKLEDTEFENLGITHIRHVARAVVLEDDKILILNVKRNDEFDVVYLVC